MFRFIKRLRQRRERKALYADMLSFVRKNRQQESGIRYCLPVSSSPASGRDGEVKYSLRDSDDAAMPKIVNVDVINDMLYRFGLRCLGTNGRR